MNDLTDLLERAAPAPTEPLDLDRVERRARTRRVRHRVSVSASGLAVIVALGGVALGVMSTGGRDARVVTVARPTATTAGPDAPKAQLLAAMKRVVSAPSNWVVRVEAVRSTHATALRLLGSNRPTDERPVWVIQAEGAFACAFGHHSQPVGLACWQARGAVPQGRVVTLVVADPPVGAPLDVSVEPTARDLSRLGAVVPLLG